MSVPSIASVLAGSYLLCSTSQSAYPKNYRHEDGGVYNGQWQGRNKQGLGSYLYPGGAKYEGEWRNNCKEGRGVYTFPKVRMIKSASVCSVKVSVCFCRCCCRCLADAGSCSWGMRQQLWQLRLQRDTVMLTLHVDIQTHDCRVVAMRGSGMGGRGRVWGSALCAQAKCLQVCPSEAGSVLTCCFCTHDPVVFCMHATSMCYSCCATCTGKS